jgi:four helix bundle protein
VTAKGVFVCVLAGSRELVVEKQTGKRANGQSGAGTASTELERQLLWRKAQGLADEIATMALALPRDVVAEPVARQLVRAAGSISANIAEGFGRYSQPAYRHHLSIARGSAFEVQSWLDLLSRREYLAPESSQRLMSGCIEVQKLLTVRMKSLGDGKTYAAREAADSDYEV